MELEIPYQDNQLLSTHSNESIIEQLIFQLIVSYDNDASANILHNVSFFQQMFEKKY